MWLMSTFPLRFDNVNACTNTHTHTHFLKRRALNACGEHWIIYIVFNQKWRNVQWKMLKHTQKDARSLTHSSSFTHPCKKVNCSILGVLTSNKKTIGSAMNSSWCSQLFGAKYTGFVSFTPADERHFSRNCLEAALSKRKLIALLHSLRHYLINVKWLNFMNTQSSCIVIHCVGWFVYFPLALCPPVSGILSGHVCVCVFTWIPLELRGFKRLITRVCHMALNLANTIPIALLFVVYRG